MSVSLFLPHPTYKSKFSRKIGSCNNCSFEATGCCRSPPYVCQLRRAHPPPHTHTGAFSTALSRPPPQSTELARVHVATAWKLSRAVDSPPHTLPTEEGSHCCCRGIPPHLIPPNNQNPSLDHWVHMPVTTWKQSRDVDFHALCPRRKAPLATGYLGTLVPPPHPTPQKAY